MSRDSSLPQPDDFRFSCPVEVRFRDLDAMGHVNNAAYVTYFEIARTGYVGALGHTAHSDAPAMTERFPFVLAELRCRYLAPASLGDRLRVYLRTPRIGDKSFDFEYLIVREPSGTPVAVGSSTQVYFAYHTQRTAPIPDDFRERLARMDEPPAGR